MVALKPCHNCRTRRLRCDRSIPVCYKCTSTGQECPGYGKLYKWVDDAASRSRVTGKTTEKAVVRPTSKTREHAAESQSDITVYIKPGLSPKAVGVWPTAPGFSLLDPLLQDLDLSSRHYLNYFVVRFCQDLVVYDSPKYGANPFRELAPMSQTYPFLREIIVAASALHFSNALRHSALRWNENPRAVVDALVDALSARGRALKALREVIEQQKLAGGDDVDDGGEKDMLLAAVLFFVNFTLLDSGRGGWRAHMNFVGKLLSMRAPGTLLAGDYTTTLTSFRHDVPSPHFRSPVSFSEPPSVRDYIASDSMAYYIWSVALDSLVSSSNGSAAGTLAFDGDDTKILHILLRTEANSYHSCPSQLLYTIFRTSKLARAIRLNGSGALNDEQAQSCLELLEATQAFDVNVWAISVWTKISEAVGYRDEVELQFRRHIAATYRAATCLYILLVAPGLSCHVYRRSALSRAGEGGLLTLPNTADLTTTILHHLSFIPIESPISKFATWPIFLTGVEAASPSRREWVLERLRNMRDLCPWGMLTSTMETLVEIWRLRDGASTAQGTESDEGQAENPSFEGEDGNKWLMQLQGLKIDCLIV
ncbi:hypothetical protein AAE478_010316 [Parahypoxylon ruwenzoriense]